MKKTSEVLIEMGITPNLKGFYYILEGVKRLESNPFYQVCKLYEDIAYEYKSNPQKVERAIRHAISKIDKNSESWEKYVGTNDTANSTVLFTLAVRLKEDEL